MPLYNPDGCLNRHNTEKLKSFIPDRPTSCYYTCELVTDSVCKSGL